MKRGNFLLMLTMTTVLVHYFTAGHALAMSASSTVNKTVKAGKQESSVAQKGSQFIDDASTTMNVQNRLMQNAMTQHLNVLVKTSEGRVVLIGTVDTAQQVRKIKRLVQEVPGVRSVTNQLKVDLRKGQSETFKKGALKIKSDSKNQQTIAQYGADAVITGKVKASFMADDVISASDISVKTNNGIVTLTGKADNQQQSKRAEKIATEIKKVRQVNNKLHIAM